MAYIFQGQHDSPIVRIELQTTALHIASALEHGAGLALLHQHDGVRIELTKLESFFASQDSPRETASDGVLGVIRSGFP
jgi:hypothetical protein